MDRGALKRSAMFGSILQVVMVLIARFVPSIGGSANFLPVAGTVLAAIAGIRYTRGAPGTAIGSSATGGLAAGGLSSVVGSALAGGLGLAPGAVVQTIGIATGSGAVAGAIGGILARFFPGTARITRIEPTLGGDEAAYRRHVLAEDRRLMVLVVVITAVLLLLANLTDAFASQFDAGALRRVWLFGAVGLFTAAIALALVRVTRPATFDRLVMLWYLGLVGAALYLRTAGAAGFTEAATVLLAFGAYTVLPVPLPFRILPAVLLTAGNLWILARWESAPAPVLLPVVLLHTAVHAIGIWSSSSLQTARRRHFTAQSREHSARTEMERIANTDDLTGLLARRRFLEDAEAEFRRFRRYGAPLTLMIADLDFFKRVNDEWGHQFGDQVLRRFADTLRAHRREPDLVGRLGGEEFGILLPETPRAAALEVAGRVLEACRALAFPAGAGVVRITCSLGLAEAGPGDASITDLLRRADAALYDAKRLGRDQARVAGG